MKMKEKVLIISYIDNEEDGPDVEVDLMDVAEIDFDPDANFYVTVTMDDGTVYECDQTMIEGRE